MKVLLHHLSDSILAAEEGTTGVDCHSFVINGDWSQMDWLAWRWRAEFDSYACIVDESSFE